MIKPVFICTKIQRGVNEMLLNKWKTDYDSWRQEDKVGHKEANIIVITTATANDSRLIIFFPTPIKKIQLPLKL